MLTSQRGYKTVPGYHMPTIRMCCEEPELSSRLIHDSVAVESKSTRSDASSLKRLLIHVSPCMC